MAIETGEASLAREHVVKYTVATQHEKKHVYPVIGPHLQPAVFDALSHGCIKYKK